MRFTILSLLFFSLPFGTRILLSDKGIDGYQSFFFYATDLLILTLFLFELFSLFFGGEERRSLLSIARGKGYVFLSLSAGLFLLGVFLSSVFSADISLGLYKTIKIAEFTLLFFYLMLLPQTVYGKALVFFIVSGVFQSILALGQFITQHDLGLRMLGENILSPGIAGVAKLDFAGEKIIRAYGTFPHPNMLAAFLLFCLFLAFFYFEAANTPPLPPGMKRQKTNSPPQGGYFAACREEVHSREKRSASYNQFIVFAIPLITLGLLLTFSRAVIFIGVLALLCWFFIAKVRPLYAGGTFLLSLIVFSSLLFPYFAARFSFNLQDQAISLRLFYIKNTFSLIREHPFLGVGPSQFTSAQQEIVSKLNLPVWTNQPVHNIYLLVASEAGLLGIFLFFWFLYEYMRLLYHKNKRIFLLRLIPPFAILYIGSFDHFFFTYQQGMLLFWSSLAFFYEARR